MTGGSRSRDAADDPWSAVSRDTLEALRATTGEPPGAGPAPGAESAVEVGQSESHEMLALLDQSVEAMPTRADLWMMRFELQRTLGLRAVFASALGRACEIRELRRQLDWNALRDMWQSVAPGEPPPPGVRFPEAQRPPPPESLPPALKVTAPLRQQAVGQRRFSDIARRLAGPELAALGEAYAALRAQPTFFQEFARAIAARLQRPSRLALAAGLTREAGGDVRIFLKREDLRPVMHETEIATAHAYLASALGRRFVVTGNDVDSYSLALAAAAPQFGLQCLVVLRPADLQRQEFVGALRRHGARIESAARFQLETDDPREAALRLWRQATERCHLALSFGTGPSPYPTMIGDFQSLLGREAELQTRAVAGATRPRTLVAAVHSEADSIGFFLPHLARPQPELLYAEPDRGVAAPWTPSERLAAYNGAIREHVWLRASGRITHVTIPDEQAREMQRRVASLEEATLSLEDARAVALAGMLARRSGAARDLVVLVA